MSDDATSPTIPVTADGKEIYDRIMREIEPDLVSDAIDTIDATYEGETPEEHVKRMERYKKAFIQYKEEYEKYRQKKQGDIRVFGKNLISTVESSATKEDEDVIDNLESAISNS